MEDPPNLYRDPSYQQAQGWPSTAQVQASQGNVQAILYLALKAFNHGNSSVALKHYRKAAKDFNNLDATLNIIKIYEFGQGVSGDIVKACQWMKKVLLAIESTPDQWEKPLIRRDVIVNYGWYMLGGKTSAHQERPQLQLPQEMRNVKDGLKWLERAIDMGEGDVASNLGNIYMTGQHPKIPKNYEKGMSCLEKAAELGNGQCAYQLAITYKIGIVPVDKDKYYHWLRKAAELGYHEALSEMGRQTNEFGIRRKAAKKQIKKLEKDRDIVSMLTTDETAKCSNPSCTATENEETGRFQVCIVCKHVKYCSKDCQTVHWRAGHKKECPKMKEQKEAMKKMNIDMLRNRIVDD